MNHADAWALLDQYLDGALTAETRWAVTAHLAACPSCRDYLAGHARMRTLVRDRLRAVEQPAGLAQRIRDAIVAEPIPLDSPRAAPRPVTLAAGIAALLAPLAVAAVLLVRVLVPAPGPPLDLVAELAAPHALFAHDESMLDVSGAPVTIAAWLEARAGFPVAAPALPGFDLAGGRLVTIDGGPAAQVVYESNRGDRYVSLFYFGKGDGSLAGLERRGEFAVGQRGEEVVVAWPDGATDAALVAALPEPDLLRLAAVAAQ